MKLYALLVLAPLYLQLIIISVAAKGHLEKRGSLNSVHIPAHRGLPFSAKHIPSNWYISHVTRKDGRFPRTASISSPLQSVVVLSRPFSALLELPLNTRAQLGGKYASAKTLNRVMKSTNLYLQVRLLPHNQESREEQVHSILVDRTSFNISVVQSALRFYYDSLHSQYTLVYSNATLFCPVMPFRERTMASRVFRFEVNLLSTLALLLNNLDRIVGVRLVAVILHKRNSFIRQEVLKYFISVPRNAASAFVSRWLAVSALESDVSEAARGQSSLARKAVLMPDDYSAKVEVWNYLTEQLAMHRDNETVNFISLASFGGIPNEVRRLAWYVMSRAHQYRRHYEREHGPDLFKRLVDKGIAFLKDYRSADDRDDYLREVRPNLLEATSSIVLFVDVPRFNVPDPLVSNYTYRSTQMLFFRVALAYSFLEKKMGYGQDYERFIWPLAQFSNNAEDVFYIFTSLMDSDSILASGHLFASRITLALQDKSQLQALLPKFEGYMKLTGRASMLKLLKDQLGSEYEGMVGIFVFNLLANLFINVLTPSQQYRVMDALILRTVSSFVVVVVVFEILLSVFQTRQASTIEAGDGILEIFYKDKLVQHYLQHHAPNNPDDLLMERISQVAERVSPII